jgi:hypothetical protein
MIGQAYEERGRYAEQPKILGGYVGEKTVKEANVVTRRGISDEMEKLRELVNLAHQYVTNLEERTAPFRRAFPQCEAKEGKMPNSIGSALTEDLSNQNDRLSALCSRLTSLIDEIDL